MGGGHVALSSEGQTNVVLVCLGHAWMHGVIQACMEHS